MTAPTAQDVAGLVERTHALDAAATPGPWRWRVNLASHVMDLFSETRGHSLVMDFVRWAMNSAQPRFIRGGLMEKASDMVTVVPGREHHARWFQTIDHPDAQLIAEYRTLAPQLAHALNALSAENAELRRDRERLDATPARDTVYGNTHPIVYHAVMRAIESTIEDCDEMVRQKVPHEAREVDYAGILVKSVRRAQEIVAHASRGDARRALAARAPGRGGAEGER